MAQPSRSIWAMIIRNFLNSLKPRQFRGNLMGSDYFGNRYYEIPANPQIGKRNASRWFDPPKKDDFMQELPAEWEAWLRGRRKEPPTEHEVVQNLAVIKMKQKNAIEVEKKAGKMTPMVKGIETFPRRTEYETVPGRRNE